MTLVTTARYIEDAPTLTLDVDACTGCRMCVAVCPHGVLRMAEARAQVADLGACMECGACAKNCPAGAISVTPGVGCAEAIIHSWIFGGEPTCGCGETGPSCCDESDSKSSGCC